MKLGKYYTTPLLFAASGTAQAVREGRKDVTRRVGHTSRWRIGAYSRCYERSPRAGGKPFGEVLIRDVTWMRLVPITPSEIEREGFSGMTPDEFVGMFARLHHREPYEVREWGVWRIEFGPLRRMVVSRYD